VFLINNFLETKFRFGDICAGLGIGRIGASAVESMARQPEVAGKVQVAMIIAAALIEGATFFAVALAFFA